MLVSNDKIPLTLYTSHSQNFNLALEPEKKGDGKRGGEVNIHVHVGWGKGGGGHRVHTERQLPLSGVHSIMMKKSTLAGEGGGCTPTCFHYIYHHVQSCVYPPAERADTLPLFHLCP
jgi:hypothetical protein